MALRFLNNLIVSGESTFQVIPSIGTSFLGDNSVFAASTAFVQAALANLPTPFQFNATSTTGIQSVQPGINANTASGVRSIAMGDGTSAGGVVSTSIGYQTTASGGSSTAMGNSTEASGSISTAMGFGTEASGYASIAIGSSTEASGSISTAMGSGTEASGSISTAMGKNTTASGFNSTAMGFGTTASGLSSVSMGQFNVINSSDTPTTFALTNTAFSIGNGTTAALTSDAFKVLFNGTTTIGTSTPIAGSMFAVSRTSAPTSQTVGIFHNINYTGVSAGANLYGGVTRTKYFGSNAASFIIAKNNVVTIDPSSTGSVIEAIGTASTATHSGSGNFSGGAGIIGAYSLGKCDSSSNFSTNQVIGNFVIASVINTGTQTVTNQVTGSASKVTFNNPNATSEIVFGASVAIEAVKGDMGDTTLLYLNMTGSYDNPDASLSIDNFAYIKADNNFAMPNVTGTSHFINSSVPLPSVFAGAITAPSFIGSSAGLTGLPFNFNTTSTSGIESPNNTASGIYSLATGNSTTASGIYSLATGSGTEASGAYSTAMGRNTVASGIYTLATGFSTTASGDYSVATGRGTESSGAYSTAIGFGTESSGFGSVSMGQFNVINAADNATTYSATNTAFSIGNGGNDINRSDAFSIKFNGDTSIAGVTSILSNFTAFKAAEVRGVFSLRDNLRIINKAGDGWLTFGERNTSAAETVYDLDNIGTISATGAVVAASFSGNGAALTSLPVSLNTPTAGIFSSSNGASGDYSTAFGLITSASGDFSTAMGKSTVSFALYSTAMGNNTQARGYGSISMGQFNVLNTGDNPTAYSATNIAFSIGNGGNNANRSDAFSIKFNGDTSMAGSIESTSFITKNGTSSQFTKADGSLDSREFPSLKASAPANSSGQAGDKAGDMFFSSAFLYYCVTDFVAAGTQCWQRIAKDATAW